MFLAGLLKLLREERGITHEQLAFDAGIRRRASRIERGLNTRLITVKRLAQSLDVTLVRCWPASVLMILVAVIVSCLTHVACPARVRD